jgi:hypothetical protein
VALALAAGATAAWANHGGSFIDLTANNSVVTHNTAVFTQGGVGAGTGNFDPYLTLSPGGSADSEQGYNFCDEAGCPDNQYDELEGGDRTHELLASAIPVTTYQGTLYRQFFLDSNDAGSDPYMSIEVIKLFLDNQKNLTDYDPLAETFGNDSGTTAAKVWDLDGAGDQTILMNTQGLESGSGVSDISVLVPDSLFPAACSYGSTTCTTYVIFYTEAGGAGIIGDRDYNTTAGFEEWRIELRPVVNVAKTASVAVTRSYPWTIAKEADGEPDHIDLFAGQSATINWTVTANVGTPTESNRTISGNITLTNPTGGSVIQDSIPAEVASVADVLTQAGLNTNLAVTCPQAFPFTIPAQGQVVCTYAGTPPNTTNGTNTATATLNLKNKQGNIIGTTSYSGSAAVDFSAATVNLVDECIAVTDDRATPANTADDVVLDSSLCYNETLPATYPLQTTVGPFTTSTCGSTTVTNTARFETLDDANDTTQNGSASDSVTVSCFQLGVSKTADESLTRTYPWQIAKEADGEPDHIDLVAGQSATINWTITASVQAAVDSGHAVNGVITISNPAPIVASNVSVSDAMTGGLTATVDCDPNTAGNQTTVNVPAKSGATNGTATCSYSRSLPDGTTRTNTATAALAGVNYTGTASVDFTGATTALVDECIAVTDDNATPGNLLDDVMLDSSLCYNETMPATYPLSTTVGPFTTETCGNTTVTNTTRFETVDDANDTSANGSANDSVTVSCFELGVTKNATTEFTRSYDWGVVKTRVLATGETDGDGDLTTLTLDEGQSFTLTYNITVSMTGSTDSGWKVSGTITINNPAPIAANSVAVADSLTGSINAVVDCDSTTAGNQATVNVAANSSATCSYSSDLPNANSRTNTATATYAGITYSGTAAVTFGTTPTTQIDECVVVTDDNGTPNDALDDVTLDASLCANEAPQTYVHTIGVGPFATCGPQQLVNTAHIVTVNDSNDTGENHDSTYTVNIDVPCPQGCTLTQGYWKTHNDSFHGGAPTDPTWDLLGPLAEETPFFLSGQTYFQVFWTAPKGNAYYNLAHQYMAAQLNMLDGADGSAISTAFSQATSLLNTYTPAQIGALKGKNGNALRAQFISLAGTLASYNEGLIGPGHCDEDASSTAAGALTTFASATVTARIDRHRMA